MVVSCGSRRAPTGGKEDTEKVTILSVSPMEFSDLSSRQVEIVFSKEVERNSIMTGFYVYPPVLKKKFSWSGTTLKIRFMETLTQDTNYYLTFNTNIRSEHGNQLDKEYVYVYKNGNLQENRISGAFVYEDKADQDLPVEMTLLDEDSVMVFRKSFTGANFVIENLNPGKYYITGFVDKSKNTLYDYEKEPHFLEKVDLKNSVSRDFQLSYADTLRPSLTSVEVVSNQEITAKFSETITSYDNLQLLRPDSVAVNIKVNKLNLSNLQIITEPLDTLKYILKIANIQDKKGNSKKTDELFVQGTQKKDTTIPKVISSKPRNGTTVNSLQPDLEIIFNKVIPKRTLAFKLIEVDTGKNIWISTKMKDDDRYVFTPYDNLKSYSTYKFIIESSTMDFSGNKLGKDFELTFIPIMSQAKKP